MRRTLTLLVLPAIFATMALAESWSGTLIDASCYDRQAQQAPTKGEVSPTALEACAPTSQTSQFALEANGKVFKLDSAGNSKAATAMKSHAERSTGAPGKASTKVMATVEGTESGGTIKADRIDIQ